MNTTQTTLHFMGRLIGYLTSPSVATVLAFAVLSAGCSVSQGDEDSDNFFRKIFDKNTYSLYRQNVQQGNAVSASKLRRLRRNMTREQVLYLLGTPITSNVFHKDRWHYYYYLVSGDKKKKYDRLTLFFEDNRLIRYSFQKKPAPSQGRPTRKPEGQKARRKTRE